MTGERALFLDRDGVINVDHGYVGTADRFEFMDGIFPLARAAVADGWRLTVVTNQSGIARGYYSEADFQALTRHMLAGFAAHGVQLAAVLHCPFHRGGSATAYARDSFWRKPNPGMILEAARRFGFDLARSAMIGDTAADMAAALAAGVGLRLRLVHGQDGGGQDGGGQDGGVVAIARPDDAIPFLAARRAAIMRPCSL